MTRLVAVLVLAGVMAVASPAAAQPIPGLALVPEDLPDPDHAQLFERWTALVARRDTLRNNVQTHNARCGSVPERSAAAADCATKQAALRATITAYADDARRFNADVEVAAQRALAAAILKEVAERGQSPEAWTQKIEGFVRDAVARTRAWSQEVQAAIAASTIPPPSTRISTLAMLEPGDILLFAPPDATSRAITKADQLARTAESLATGEVLQAETTHRRDASHAATVVRKVAGRLMILDHTLVGSRILGEPDFQRFYGGRNYYVARPRDVVDGRALWAAAREAALQKKSDFGLLGDKVVCSERAALAVALATGQTPSRRLGPVDMTPADFFDAEGRGKHFVIMPFGKDPTLAIQPKP